MGMHSHLVQLQTGAVTTGPTANFSERRLEELKQPDRTRLTGKTHTSPPPPTHTQGKS